MLVSVVTPAHNAAGFLAEQLASVRAQTFSDWEHIVVDDGSTDGTAEIVALAARADPRVKLLRQAHAGMAVARNRGVGGTEPASDALVFLDADDRWRPSSLAWLVTALTLAPGSPAAHGRAASIDEVGRPLPRPWAEALGRHRFEPAAPLRLRPTPLAEGDATPFDALVVRNPITTPGQVLVRRADFEAVGGFDANADAAADWDLWLRLARRGPIAYVPEVVLDWRQHDGNATKGLSRLRRDERYVRFKTMGSPHCTPAMRRLVRRGVRRAEATRVKERLALTGRACGAGSPVTAIEEAARAVASLVDIATSFAPPSLLRRLGPAPEAR